MKAAPAAADDDDDETFAKTFFFLFLQKYPFKNVDANDFKLCFCHSDQNILVSLPGFSFLVLSIIYICLAS